MFGTLIMIGQSPKELSKYCSIKESWQQLINYDKTQLLQPDR